MTHLLPPNLLKLFAPRPPLPYVRPAGRAPEKITPKTVNGVADLVAQIREDKALAESEAGLKKKNKEKKKETKAQTEEGEEEEESEDESDGETFTYAEEVRRQIRREERQKKRKEAFEKAKETCEYLALDVSETR